MDVKHHEKRMSRFGPADGMGERGAEGGGGGVELRGTGHQLPLECVLTALS